MRRRKDKPAQFLACLRGWCQYFRAPPFELYREPGAKPSREDRCLIYATPEWLEWIEANSQGPERCLEPWRHGIERHRPLGGLCANVSAIAGWRGTRAFGAIQIIHHCPDGLPECAEIDFDIGNPGRGVLPAAYHFFGEWLPHTVSGWFGRRIRTNPYRVAKWMRKAGIRVEKV